MRKWDFMCNFAEKYAPGEKVRSIFDVLEPIFNHFAEVPEKESPFTYEKISPMPRHYGTPADKYTNTEGSKKLFVNNISSLSVYESDQLLKMETVESKNDFPVGRKEFCF